MDDVSLTFDYTSFSKGLSSIENGISQMNRNFENLAKNSTKGFKKMKISAMSFAKATAMISVAYLSIRKVMNTIPEIGRAFSIAGNIITKNLLWPLRKYLTPLLQKMLDWVRDNRSVFLKWGNTVLQVFKIIKNVISGIWGFIQNFWQSLSGHFERIFGKTTQTITDMTNLILFKIASIVAFLRVSFEPLGSLFGGIFGKLIGYSKEFLKGFIKGLGDLEPEFKLLMGWLRELARLLRDSKSEMSSLGESFKNMGKVLGSTLGLTLKVLASAVDSIKTGLKESYLLVKLFLSWMGKDTTEQSKLLKQLEKTSGDFHKREKERQRGYKDTWSKIYDSFKSGKNIFLQGSPFTNPFLMPFKKREVESVPPKKGIQELGDGSFINQNKSISQVSNINNRTDSKKSNVTMNNNIDIFVEGQKEAQGIAEDISRGLRSVLKEQQFKAGIR